MTRRLPIVQKPKGSQKELFDESKKEQPQRWVKQAYPSCATECSGYLRNVYDKVADGKSYEKRFGVTFDGLLIPFGTKGSYWPISSKYEPRLQFGKQMLPGIFVGYVLRAGRGGAGRGVQ